MSLAADIDFYFTFFLFTFSRKSVSNVHDSLRQVCSRHAELHRTCCATLCFVLIAINHSVQQIRVGDTHFLRGSLSGRASTNLGHHATHKETENKRRRWSSIDVDSSKNAFNICEVYHCCLFVYLL